jgi:DNA polymerase bacteriophage-type
VALRDAYYYRCLVLRLRGRRWPDKHMEAGRSGAAGNITTADENSDWSAAAFNDGFERLIEQHILAPRYGWPVVPIQQHRCLQAAALALALPARLESVAKALSLTQQKDAEGHKLMMQMARPRRPRRGEDPNGIYWFGDPERIRRLHEYCRQDVNVERELFYPRRLPQCG